MERITKFNKFVVACITLATFLLTEFGIEVPNEDVLQAVELVIGTLLVYFVPNRYYEPEPVEAELLEHPDEL